MIQDTYQQLVFKLEKIILTMEVELANHNKEHNKKSIN